MTWIQRDLSFGPFGQLARFGCYHIATVVQCYAWFCFNINASDLISKFCIWGVPVTGWLWTEVTCSWWTLTCPPFPASPGTAPSTGWYIFVNVSFERFDILHSTNTIQWPKYTNTPQNFRADKCPALFVTRITNVEKVDCQDWSFF